MKNDRVLPKAVALVGVCPNCKESCEIPMSKDKAREIYKGAKGRIMPMCGVKFKCSSCGKDVELMLDKKQIKEMWEGFRHAILAS